MKLRESKGVHERDWREERERRNYVITLQCVYIKKSLLYADRSRKGTERGQPVPLSNSDDSVRGNRVWSGSLLSLRKDPRTSSRQAGVCRRVGSAVGSVGSAGTRSTYLPGFGFCREHAEGSRHVLQDRTWGMTACSLKERGYEEKRDANNPGALPVSVCRTQPGRYSRSRGKR